MMRMRFSVVGRVLAVLAVVVIVLLYAARQ
jgi:hypothetical protein